MCAHQLWKGWLLWFISRMSSVVGFVLYFNGWKEGRKIESFALCLQDDHRFAFRSQSQAGFAYFNGSDFVLGLFVWKPWKIFPIWKCSNVIDEMRLIRHHLNSYKDFAKGTNLLFVQPNHDLQKVFRPFHQFVLKKQFINLLYINSYFCVCVCVCIQHVSIMSFNLGITWDNPPL